ncbi:MAG: hypothetical protein WKG00_27650 [Polyangiaceae bacterium]
MSAARAGGGARAIVAAALACALGAGCGGAAKSAEEPTVSSAVAQGDVGGTLAEMDRAEADLAQALGDAPVGGTTAGSGKPESPAGDGAGAAVTPSTHPRPVDASPPRVEGKSKDDEGGGCNIAKRALGSLQRAAEHLCGLTGEADPRCDTARGRAHRAAERVGAACPP